MELIQMVKSYSRHDRSYTSWSLNTQSWLETTSQASACSLDLCELHRESSNIPRRSCTALPLEIRLDSESLVHEFVATGVL